MAIRGKKRAAATEAKNRFGEFMEKARHEPVTVEKTGRKYVVMVNHTLYIALIGKRNGDEVYDKLKRKGLS